MNETQTPDKSSIKPSRGWYLAALGLALLGPILAIVLFVLNLNANKLLSNQTLTTGSNMITIHKPGKYYLHEKNKLNWTESSIIIKKLDASKKIESLSINSMPPIDLDKDYIEFKHPGIYKIILKGSPDKEIKLVGSSIKSFFSSLLYSILLALIGIIGGIILAITVSIRRSKAKSQLKQTAAPKSTEIEQNNEGNNWAMLCHLSAFIGFLIPLANIFAPLIFWLVKKKEYAIVDDQGKQALNFQLSILIYYFIAFLLVFFIIGIFLFPLILLFQVILVIIASIEAAHGKYFRYPLAIPFLN